MSINTQKHFVVILGARPNFVKAASFFNAAKGYKDVKITLIHTGQHFDENMSKIFFDEMEIPKPDVHLDIKAEKYSEKLGKMITSLREEIEKIKPRAVIVFGDINSTLASAVGAVAADTKLVHIEAGLRSYDRRMPEETNRIIVDHLSEHLFASEEQAVTNLKLEGVPEEKVSLVGNIMINSLELFEDKIDASNILTELNLKKKDYVVATIHRAENTDDPSIFKSILKTLDELAKEHQIVFPLHPGTKAKISSYGFDNLLEKLNVIEPIGYFDFNKLVKESAAVVTDSGGIQEETTHMQVTCCTLRDNTERPITTVLGTNKLFPIESLDSKEISEYIKSEPKGSKVPLWDNQVATRIIDIIIEKF